MSDTQVVIRRSGNILEVEPAMQGILGSTLTYRHRNMRAGMEAIEHGPVEIYDRDLYKIVDGKLLTMQGALQLITHRLDQCRVPWTFEDLRKVQKLQANIEHLKLCMPNLQFRLKQKEVLAHLMGINSGQIIAPTAYGKTFLMMAIVALYPDANIVIASPSASLLSSGYRRVRQIAVDVGRVGDGHNRPNRVTMATLQSLEHAPIDKCDILLVDESHRIAAPTLSRAVAKVRNAVKYFGMTATPFGRSDGAELVAEVLLGPKVYEIEYQEAVEAGIISQLKVGMLSLDRDECPRVVSQDFSMTIARKRHGYWRNQARNQKFAWAMENVPQLLGMQGNLQKLLICKTLEHALHLWKLLPDYDIVYSSLAKDKLQRFIERALLPPDYRPITKKQREAKLAAFEAGELRKVIATGTWGEGVDFVHLSVLGNPSGEPSPIDLVQWSGRNSRLNEQPFGLVIDCDDKWDPWASRRASSRRTLYRKKGWEVVYVNNLMEEQECPK